MRILVNGFQNLFKKILSKGIQGKGFKIRYISYKSTIYFGKVRRSKKTQISQLSFIISIDEPGKYIDRYKN